MSAIPEVVRTALAGPDCIVKLTRPDGTVTYVRVPQEHWERVVDLANGEFGDKSIEAVRA